MKVKRAKLETKELEKSEKYINNEKLERIDSEDPVDKTNEVDNQDQDTTLGGLLEGWDLIPSLVPTFKKPTEEENIEVEPPDLGFNYPGNFCLECASIPCLCILLKVEMKLNYLQNEPIWKLEDEKEEILAAKNNEVKEDEEEKDEDTKELKTGGRNSKEIGGGGVAAQTSKLLDCNHPIHH